MTRRNSIKLANIVQAAAEIVDAHGAAELSLNAVAQRLNIRTPSLYNHIDSLQAIRTMLSVHGLELLRTELIGAAVGRSGDEAIREIAKAYKAFARAHPGLYDMTLHAPNGEDPQLSQVAQDILDVVIRVLQAYQLGEAATIHMARALRSVMHGFASLEQQGGFGLPVDLDESFTELLETFLAGLHSRFSGSMPG